MQTDRSYTLEFLFDKDNEALDHLFPSIELLIRSLENIDIYLVNALGYSIAFKRFLKNIGDDSFLFSIRTTLIKPEQFLLGENFSLANVIDLLESGRKLFVEAANGEDLTMNPQTVTEYLQQLIVDLDLDHSILFKGPQFSEIEKLSEDLKNAVNFLGGKVVIS